MGQAGGSNGPLWGVLKQRGVQGTQAKGSWTPDLEFKQQDQLEVEVWTEGTGEAVPATAGHGAMWGSTGG